MSLTHTLFPKAVWNSPSFSDLCLSCEHELDTARSHIHWCTKKISKQVLIFLPNITKSRIFCSAWPPGVGFSIFVYRPHTHYNNHRGVWKWAFWSRKPGKEIHMQWSDLKIKDSNEGCRVELGNIGFLRSHVLKNQMASNRLLVCQFPWLMK